MYVDDSLKIHNWKHAILLLVFEIPWPGDIFLKKNPKGLKKVIILVRHTF